GRHGRDHAGGTPWAVPVRATTAGGGRASGGDAGSVGLDPRGDPGGPDRGARPGGATGSRRLLRLPQRSFRRAGRAATEGARIPAGASAGGRLRGLARGWPAGRRGCAPLIPAVAPTAPRGA